MIRQPVILTQTPKPNLPLIVMLLRFMGVIWDLIFLFLEINSAAKRYTEQQKLKVMSGCGGAVLSACLVVFVHVCKKNGVCVCVCVGWHGQLEKQKAPRGAGDCAKAIMIRHVSLKQRETDL